MNLSSRSEGQGDGSPAPVRSTLFEVADLYRIPGWVVTKAAYAFAPISLLFRVAAIRGAVDAFRSPVRLEALEPLDPRLDEGELRLIARRHLQFRRRARLARLWPQIRNFAGAESIEVEGLHHLDEALAAGKGAILVSAHYGYARLIKPILASRGRRALIVGPSKPLRPPADPPISERDKTLTLLFPPLTRLGNLIHTRVLHLPHASPFDQRRVETMRVDLQAEMNLRPHLAALERNETLIILADGLMAHAPRPVPVLGTKVHFALGPVSLARAMRTPLLPTFVVDDLKRKHPVGLRLIIYPPLHLQVTSDANADHEVNLRLFAAVYQQQVRTQPHLWFERRSEWEVRRLAFPSGFARSSVRHNRGGTPTFELRDLCRIPLWVTMKPLYALAPISLLFRMATARGTVDSFVSGRRAELLETLDHYLGDEKTRGELRLIARRHFEFRRRGAFARVWPQVRNFAGAESIEIDGLQHLDEALASGKGVVLVSAHYGYARLIKPILRSRGRKALLVGTAPRGGGPQDFPPFFTRLGGFVHTRVLRLPRASTSDERWNATVGVDLCTDLNLRPHLAALARNEILIILADGRASQALRRVMVLGIDVHLAPGAVSLARSAGAAALPAFVIDEPASKDPPGLRLVIYPPLDLQVTQDANADHEVNLQRFAAVYEDHARRYPHNWHWTWVRDGAFANPN